MPTGSFVMSNVSRTSSVIDDVRFSVCLVSSVNDIDRVKLTDTYLQEQLTKVLKRTVDDRRPLLNASSDHIQIVFNEQISSMSNRDEPLPILNVSYCYATKEWRCLYRCEIDGSSSSENNSTVGLTLFGSVNNPTDEDWSQVELKLIANELEILNNNKSTTVPTSGTTSREEKSEQQTSSGGGMQLYIKTLTGKTITIDVNLKH
jgi:hypothetical protein